MSETHAHRAELFQSLRPCRKYNGSYKKTTFLSFSSRRSFSYFLLTTKRTTKDTKIFSDLCVLCGSLCGFLYFVHFKIKAGGRLRKISEESTWRNVRFICLRVTLPLFSRLAWIY